MENQDQVQDAQATNEAASEVIQDDTQQPKAPVNVLLSAISYENEADYQAFLNNMDINQALFVIVSGCTHAQSKSAYTLGEAELIAKAIKTIKNQSSNPSAPSNEGGAQS